MLTGDPAGRDDDWRRIVDHCIYLDSRHAVRCRVSLSSSVESCGPVVLNLRGLWL